MQSLLPVSKAFLVWSIVHSDAACANLRLAVHPDILERPRLGSSFENEVRLAMLRHGNDRDWLAELLRRATCPTLVRLEPGDFAEALTALRHRPLRELAKALTERPGEDHTDLFHSLTADYVATRLRPLRQMPPEGVQPQDVLTDLSRPGMDFHRTVWIRDTKGKLILADGHHRILALMLNGRPLDLFALHVEVA